MILIGDIHGNYDTLMALLDKIPAEEKAKGICLVGDLIDRGPKSMQVVDWAIKNNIDSVTGNHEIMMADSGPGQIQSIKENGRIHSGRLRDRDTWIINGGHETMFSYTEQGIREKTSWEIEEKDIDIKKLKEHIEWMEKLPLYKEYKDVKNDKGEHLLVTHSSAHSVWKWSEKRRSELSEQFSKSIVWSRPNTIKPISNIFNVFGHTPIASGPRLKSCYANIDTGCFLNHSKYFKLTALQFPEMIVFEQVCIDTPVYKVF